MHVGSKEKGKDRNHLIVSSAGAVVQTINTINVLNTHGKWTMCGASMLICSEESRLR